jgi:Domain of unknown function (DUF5069)
MSNPKLLSLAPDLTRETPRSALSTFGIYGAVLARIVDKCRAELAGSSGPYHFNCPLDQKFFRFTGIDAEEFRSFVATGAGDDEIAHWTEKSSKVQDLRRIRTWSRQFQFNPIVRILDLDDWLHRLRNRKTVKTPPSL